MVLVLNEIDVYRKIMKNSEKRQSGSDGWIGKMQNKFPDYDKFSVYL